MQEAFFLNCFHDLAGNYDNSWDFHRLKSFFTATLFLEIFFPDAPAGVDCSASWSSQDILFQSLTWMSLLDDASSIPYARCTRQVPSVGHHAGWLLMAAWVFSWGGSAVIDYWCLPSARQCVRVAEPDTFPPFLVVGHLGRFLQFGTKFKLWTCVLVEGRITPQQRFAKSQVSVFKSGIDIVK